MYLDIALAASNMYGSLTMIVFIMIWMYFCMWILLIGAEINAYFEDKLRKLQNAAIEHFMEIKRRIKKRENNGLTSGGQDGTINIVYESFINNLTGKML